MRPRDDTTFDAASTGEPPKLGVGVVPIDIPDLVDITDQVVAYAFTVELDRDQRVFRRLARREVGFGSVEAERIVFAFAELHQVIEPGDPVALAAFVEAWGPLGLCTHGLPASHHQPPPFSLHGGEWIDHDLTRHQSEAAAALAALDADAEQTGHRPPGLVYKVLQDVENLRPARIGCVPQGSWGSGATLALPDVLRRILALQRGDAAQATFRVNRVGGFEPVSAWVRFSRQAWGVLKVADELRRGREPHSEHLVAAFDHDGRSLHHRHRGLDVDAKLDVVVNGWLAAGGLRMELWSDGGSRKVRLTSGTSIMPHTALAVPAACGGVFGVIAGQLALYVLGKRALSVCDGCGAFVTARRRPPAGRRVLCDECRPDAARQASAKYYAESGARKRREKREKAAAECAASPTDGRGA